MRFDVPSPPGAGIDPAGGSRVAGSTRPLLPLAAAFCIGIALEHVLALRPAAWTTAVAILLLLGGGAWWRGMRRLLSAGLILLFAGLGGQAMAVALFGDPAHHL
ncbi:MAG: hypothetical protein HYW08_01670, partial [candidate division NC10 bacterium]|nr:hypothetical protein [candidate division NC10 bacterium]